jgi:hypothetical protein
MAEAEPEPHAERSLVLTHELAGRVVDGCDVVSVESVPYAERVLR